MTIEHKSVQGQQSKLTLLKIFNIASSAYPDDFLKEYHNLETGKVNEQGSGDTLAEFIVREIVETYDPEADKETKLTEVCRVLRQDDWSEHATSTRAAWRTEVASHDTQLGY